MSSVNFSKRALMQMTGRVCAAFAFATSLIGRRASAALADVSSSVAGDALSPLHAQNMAGSLSRSSFPAARW